MTPTALQKREYRDWVPLDAQSKQHGQSTSNFPSDAGRSEGWNVTEREDQGTVAGQPPVMTSERTPTTSQRIEDARHSVRSGRSEGECQ